MKIAVAFLAVVGLVAAASVPEEKAKLADKEFLARQKFLLEIVYRVEDPLMFEEYIKLGKSFTLNKEDYGPNGYTQYMDKYYQAYEYGVTLPKGEFFGAMVHSHYEQLLGLFEFFYEAETWELFQRNVCWARLHANEGMFVQALTLALIHNVDYSGLKLPAIYEIFPQYFFNSKFVYQAEKFDYNVWSKYIMYEKEYKDLMYTDYTKYFKEYDNYNYFYTKDWKMWQWWKLMGLGEHWYSVDSFMLRENSFVFNKDSKYMDMLKDVKKFWMPVDYTRDIDFFNKESALSYFTEDLDWNAFWYYFNLQYSALLNGDSFGLHSDRRGSYWLYVVRQLLSRYYMERLSHGYGEIPEFSFVKEIEFGYDPQLISYNGVGYSYRKNYYEFESYGNFEYLHKVLAFFRRVEGIITQGYYTTAEGKTIDMRKPESIEYIGNMMHGNIDAMDGYFSMFWYMFAHTYLADVDDTKFVFPNVFLNYETMMRDPLFYMAYKKIADVFYHFYNYIEPYTQKELLLPGVTFKDVKISDLVTYFDLVDFDVTNLMNDKMTFVDGEFVWDKSLFARQMRLNHKRFNFDFTVESDKAQKIVVRAFLGPKYDEFGRVISLSENRENFMEIDDFTYELTAGVNTFKRSSGDFDWTFFDRTTYTEMYKFIMLAQEGNFDYYMDHKDNNLCGFPNRLVLPHGWVKGMPMQFFFFITAPVEITDTVFTYFYDKTCGFGSGINHVNNKVFGFGYPFDREIDEFEFFVPNMYFQDVKIYHEETFDKYYGDYEKFGTFDYEYYNTLSAKAAGY